MCGIAGVLTTDAGRLDLRPELDAMQRALRHRGPDDAGQWQSPGGLAGFAHTRLSIIDLGPGARQPMRSPDHRFAVVFNGEIYNFRELRRTLEQQGAAFRSGSDTEVILRAYEAYGEACVERFRGMFAFALWDEQEQTCLLARDRFGIKPLYYHADGGPLVFASEVRALLASPLVPRDLDARAVYQYFRTGSVPEPRTLLRKVRCLEAGHVGLWRLGRLQTKKYWSLQFAPAPVPVAEAVASTRAALLDSVEHHFVSDVPVGIFLSGGIDSTALLALARATGRTNVHTFSMSLPGSANDEGLTARRTAAHFGSRHEEYPVDAASGKSLFASFLRAADQPSIDGLNTFAVAGFARERGLKVALSGIGADEIFGGYRSFQDVPRLARWDGWLSGSGPARRHLGRLLERAAIGPRWRRIGDMLGQQPGLTTAYDTFRGIFTRAEARALAARYAGNADEDADDGHDDGPPDLAPEDTVSRLELTRYVRNQLLRESDVMSMAWGLEVRTPFLDRGLIDAVSVMPAAVRLRPGKQLLLDAVPEIPAWVVQQPKRCFQFPFDQWLDGEWRDVFAQVERGCPVPTDTWYRKWSVFMLERWVERVATVSAVRDAAPAAAGGRVHG
ncbi:MAG: asparagine synthase (glutamine-hydrolyzing) [Vicinamibacterales bacterium]